MSGILGVVNLNGRPVSESSLYSMGAALPVWSPETPRVWCSGNCGLTQLTRDDSSESQSDVPPLTLRAGNQVLAATARLDNRKDLLRLLAIAPDMLSGMSDRMLILRAWEKWGPDCPQHLLGDWAFAVWDHREQQLFMARDQFGNCGLYYYHCQDTFVFASTIRGVLAAPGVPCELNAEAVAQLHPERPHDQDTPYRGIRRLTPGRCMSVTHNGLQQRQYWHPSQAREVRFRRDEEYVDAFQEIYTEAVRCRLRSDRPVAATLSGGLDSGSIAALAAGELAKNNQRLVGITSVPEFQTESTTSSAQFGDERPYVELLQKHCGNIDVSYVTASHISPVAGIRKVLDACDEPIIGGGNFFWLCAILEEAKRQNIGTLLDGQWGNLTVSWAGNRQQYLRTLIKQGRLRQYSSEVLAWRREQKKSLWQAFKSQVVRTMIPSEWVLRRICRQRQSDTLMFREDFLQSLPPAEDPFVKDPKIRDVDSFSAHRKLYVAMQHGNLEAWGELAAAYGMTVATPVVDIRVLEFCFGIPQHQYTRNGGNRLLIRRAMKGRMPAKVLWNKRRGKQSADIIHRLRKHRDEVHALLQDLKSSTLASEVLDVPRMIDVFEKAQNSVSVEITQAVICLLMKGLTIGMFLQRFDARHNLLSSGKAAA